MHLNENQQKSVFATPKASERRMYYPGKGRHLEISLETETLKLRQQGLCNLLLSIHLANVQSLANKIEELLFKSPKL